MFVRSVQLKNYRNHKTLNLKNLDQINLVTGPNASGKSNIMEAILRFNAYNKEGANAVMFGRDVATVQIEVQKGASTAKHSLVAEKNEERTRISKKQPLGPLPIVCFTPAEGDLFGAGPQQRRHFLDLACSLFKKRYTKDLLDYQRIMRQKNDILKKGNADKRVLGAFNQQLVIRGEAIIKERIGFLGATGPVLKDLYHQLTGENKFVEVKYSSKTDPLEIKESLHAQLEQRRELESLRGCCLVGPHRDDFSLAVDNIDVSTFGSQGEKRTGCLALKIALVKLLQKAGVKPLLILDDALSELDDRRRRLLIQTINQCEQVFITATDADNLGLNENIRQFQLGHQ